MKLLSIVLLVTVAAMGQNAPWQKQQEKACTDINHKVEATVIAFNKAHPKTPINFMCTMSLGDDAQAQKENHYSLTPSEISHLHDLRIRSDAAGAEQDAYEKELMRRHGHPELSFSDPCWHYVGIKIDDDYISEMLLSPLEKEARGCRP